MSLPRWTTKLKYLIFPGGSEMPRKGQIVSEETKRRISISMTGRVFSQKHREKISENARKNSYGKHFPHIYTKEMAGKISRALKGKIFTEEHKKKLSESLKGRVSEKKGKTYEEIYGNEKGTRLKETLSTKHKGKPIWNKGLNKSDPRILKSSLKQKETKNKIDWKMTTCRNLIDKIKKTKGDLNWKSTVGKESIIKGLKTLEKRGKTYLERDLENIINKHGLPYKYTGDGSFIIGFLNPDFVNTNGEKVAIEVYYSYYKNRSFGSEENYQKWRNTWLGRYGWKAVYLNENDMMSPEEEIIDKIKG